MNAILLKKKLKIPDWDSISAKSADEGSSESIAVVKEKGGRPLDPELQAVAGKLVEVVDHLKPKQVLPGN